MPLIIMVGMPGSGKTTRASQIADYFKSEQGKEVHIVSENEVIKSEGLEKNAFFMDSQKEREIRGILKSNALRHLRRDNVVILDASNYIKGFRYELYCASKNSKTTQATVECVARLDGIWDWNTMREEEDRYNKETFDSLVLRYEAPDSRNRWDSPLFFLQPDSELNTTELNNALFGRKPPPPNLSTQTVPLASSSCLYELDRITQEVVNEILEAKKLGLDEGTVKLSCFEDCTLDRLPTSLTPAQMARHRRQFINYTKIHPPSNQPDSSDKKLAQLFVQFLNTTFATSP